MKIIYFHQYFNTPDMIGGTRSFEFARRLVLMGHRVDIITSYREKKNLSNWFRTRENGIYVHWLPVPYSNHMNFYDRLKAFFRFAWFSATKALDLNADIIYASSTPLTIALPAIFASKRKKIPMVFEVRDLWPKIPIALGILKNPFLCFLANLLEKAAYYFSDSIVVLSPDMKNQIISKNKISSNKIAVIPNSCDIKDFKYNKKLAVNFKKDRPWLNNNPILVYAGAFGKVNNLLYAVKLAKALKKQKSNIKILLIGDGFEKFNIIKEAKKNNVFNYNLFFEDPIPKKQIRACFSAATMCANFVIDTKETWANSANKFFDTLATGKPIFLNHGGWMQALVSLNKCGIAIYNEPIYKVAKKLDRYMNDKKSLAKAEKQSTKLAKNYFNRDILAKKLESVLLTNYRKQKINMSEIAPGIYKKI